MLFVALDPGVEVRNDGSTVILVTLEADAVSGTTGAPIVAAAGLLALLGLRRPRRRLLTLSLAAAIALAGCAQTPVVAEATTIRLHLTDAAFSAEDARAVGTPVAGRSITVRP